MMRNQTKIHLMKNLALALVMIGFFSACSLKDPKQAYNITVQMPNSSSVSSKSLVHQMTDTGTTASPTSSSTPAPGDIASNAAYNGISCFALNVVGSGITADPGFGITDGTMGQMIGTSNISGGAVSGTVSAGASRTIQLLGIKFSSATAAQQIGCMAFADILASPNKNAIFNNIAVFLLGQTTTDVFADVSVSIAANFSSTTQMFNNGGGDGGGGNNGFNIQFVQSSLLNSLTNTGQTILSGAPDPGTFKPQNGKPPYSYTFTTSNNMNNPVYATLTPSADTLSAVITPHSPLLGSISSMNRVSVTLTVTDSSTPVQTTQITVNVSGNPSGVGLIGPFAGASNSCIPFQVASVDAAGNPAYNATAMTPTSSLGDSSHLGNFYIGANAKNCNAADYIPDPSTVVMAVPAGQVVGTFNSSTFVYYLNASPTASSFVITPSINNNSFTLGQAPYQYGFQLWSSPGSLPLTIAQGQCLSAEIQFLLEDSSGKSTADGNSRNLLLKGDGNSNFYSDSNCTQIVNSTNLSAFQASTGGYYIMTTGPQADGNAYWYVSDDQGITHGTLQIGVAAATTIGAITSATTSSDLQLSLSFSEGMNYSSLNNAANYSITSSKNSYFPVLGPAYTAFGNGNSVNLTWYLPNSPAASLCPGDVLSVGSVTDALGFPLVSTSHSIVLGGYNPTPNSASSLTISSGTGSAFPQFEISATNGFTAGDIVTIYTDSNCQVVANGTTPTTYTYAGTGQIPLDIQVGGSGIPIGVTQFWTKTISRCGLPSTGTNNGCTAFTVIR